ncbi:MAG: glycoside hydrolase family 3 C-terminal domain-containing protein [Clostridia bacterium]|nr:glycoside hydrolase family 3 C-terminal domain-containing protein [Clostridia bacterium]
MNANKDDKIKLLSGKDFWTTSSVEGVKSIRFADGPSGLRAQHGKGDHLGLNGSAPATCFPAHSALAQSWNRRLCFEVGFAIGQEAKRANVDILLAPDLNIKRSPLCGRNFEYFSEDAYLNGFLGASFANGVKEAGVGACLKHFAANNKERGRMVCDSVADERTLREIYLTAFEIAVKESAPAAVMTAYNRLNGTYCSEHKILNNVLRGEWGFDGITVSDWGGTLNRPAAAAAGLDVEMPACKLSLSEINSALESGTLSEEQIEVCAQRIIKTVEGKRTAHSIPVREDLAKKCAEECAVLLKNDGALPLKDCNAVLVGEYAAKPLIQGGGSSKVNPESVGNLKDILPYKFAYGYKGERRKKRLEKKALKLCKSADTVIYCMGAAGDLEGADRRNLKMPENQTDLLKKILKQNKRVVVVLFGGCAVDTSWDKHINALLYTGLSGQDGAAAIAEILQGKVNPSGKLAETFPEDLNDLPSTRYFNESPYYTLYGEGMKVGYLSKVKAKYAFGFGLSYTRFKYSDLKINESGASFLIENVGEYYGGESAQMYIEYPQSANAPSPFLKGFEKVFLNAGEKKRVEIKFDEYSFRSYDVWNKKWVRVGGEYKIHIGAASDDLRLSSNIILDGENGVPVPDTQSLKPAEYKINRTKKGRVIVDLNTPLCEVKNAKGFFGRLFAKAALYFVRNKPTVYGSMEFLPLRTMAQFGKMKRKTIEGLISMFNGSFFKGLSKFFKREKRG